VSCNKLYRIGSWLKVIQVVSHFPLNRKKTGFFEPNWRHDIRQNDTQLRHSAPSAAFIAVLDKGRYPECLSAECRGAAKIFCRTIELNFRRERRTEKRINRIISFTRVYRTLKKLKKAFKLNFLRFLTLTLHSHGQFLVRKRSYCDFFILGVAIEPKEAKVSRGGIIALCNLST
jgi:hypothetical protein